jgi:hypothetical protein
MHRATRLVKDGHVVEGVIHAARSLTSVPPTRRGRFVLAVAVDVLNNVPSRESHRPQVMDYHDQLAAAGYNPPPMGTRNG